MDVSIQTTKMITITMTELEALDALDDPRSVQFVISNALEASGSPKAARSRSAGPKGKRLTCARCGRTFIGPAAMGRHAKACRARSLSDATSAEPSST